MKFRCVALLLASSLSVMVATAQPRKSAPAPEGCGQSHNLYGPFDYRTAQPGQRFIVENRHFTEGVENLTKGSTGPFGGDISYTLEVFPNHPRAIYALERLVDKEKLDPPRDSSMTVECFYARGMEFAPDDLVFRMLYVSYLIRHGRLDEAHRFLAYVVERAGDSAITNYNAGMLYFDMKDYDKALIQAHRAMALGMSRPDLSERLKSVNQWREPEPARPADLPASAASAASAVGPAASQTTP